MQLSVLTIAVLFVSFIMCANKLLVSEKKHEDMPDPYPVYWPEETMMENYASIMEDIDQCNNKTGLNKVYVRLIVFQSCFTDSASFLSELYEAYRSKEIVYEG